MFGWFIVLVLVRADANFLISDTSSSPGFSPFDGDGEKFSDLRNGVVKKL